jgi:hypothetical protein
MPSATTGLGFATPPAPPRGGAGHAGWWEASQGIRAGGVATPDSARRADT